MKVGVPDCCAGIRIAKIGEEQNIANRSGFAFISIIPTQRSRVYTIPAKPSTVSANGTAGAGCHERTL
jgi:hypothetical protein